jgi:hypothetical protein
MGVLLTRGLTAGVGVGVVFTGSGVTGVPTKMRWKSEAFLGFGVGVADGEGDGDTLARTLGLGVSPGDACGVEAETAAVEGVGETFGFGLGVGVGEGVGVARDSGGVTSGGEQSAIRPESDIAASTMKSAKNFLIGILSN